MANAEPSYQGALFVSDLASGLYVSVTPVGRFDRRAPSSIPVQGSGPIGVTTDASGNVIPIMTNGNSTFGTNDFGGRILRVLPDGTVNIFAYGFDTNGAQDYTSFVNSSLSISFSADGTTLYASDDDAIWQFKTTADLADSTSGTLVGLNDLRTLGVPYDGQNSAVDVVDTGVDATVPSFRGRVAPGTNIFTGGLGNQDLSSNTISSTTGGAGGAGGGGAGGGGGGGGGGWWRQLHSVQWSGRARHAGRGRDRTVRAASDTQSHQHLRALHRPGFVELDHRWRSGRRRRRRRWRGWRRRFVRPFRHRERPDVDQSAL